MNGDRVKRQYDNSLREEAARGTQRRVLDAAYRLLVERGYAATSMNDIAREAGVSRETLYKSFGSKAALVKQVWDVTLVGDAAPVPLRQRAEMRDVVEEPDPYRQLARYAGVARQLVSRLGPLAAALLAGGRGGDPELRALAETLNTERLIGAGGVVGQLAKAGALRPGLTEERARDIVWTLISPEVWQLLVDDRGWSLDEYEEWLAGALTTALLVPRVPEGERR